MWRPVADYRHIVSLYFVKMTPKAKSKTNTTKTVLKLVYILLGTAYLIIINIKQSYI